MSEEDKKVLDAETPREFIDELKKETGKTIKKLDDSTTVDERTANILKDIIKGFKSIARDVKEDATEKV